MTICFCKLSPSDHQFLCSFVTSPASSQLVPSLHQRLHPRRRPSHTYSTATDSRPQVTRLEGLGHGLLKLLVLIDGGEPVGVCRGVVVAPALAVALNEGPRAEVLQAGAGAGQVLAGALRTGVGVLEKVRLPCHIKRQVLVFQSDCFY